MMRTVSIQINSHPGEAFSPHAGARADDPGSAGRGVARYAPRQIFKPSGGVCRLILGASIAAARPRYLPELAAPLAPARPFSGGGA